MKEAGSVGSTYRLLEPHVRPRVWVLLLVVLLGAGSAFGQRGVYLLLEPTWSALFPGESVRVEPSAPAAEPAPDESGFAARLDALRDRAFEALVGPDVAAPTVEQRIDRLKRVSILVVAIAFVVAACQYAFTWLARWVALRMVIELRARIARHLMSLSMRYHGRRQFGDLLSRISSDVTTTLQVVNHALRDLVQEPLLGLASLVTAFWSAPQATLIVALALPIVVAPIAVFSRRVRRGSTKSSSSLGASVQTLTEMFRGIRTVKAFRAEERELERYDEVNARYQRATMRMVRALALSEAWTALFSHVGIAVMVFVIGWLSVRFGQFQSGGDMATFFISISMVYSSIKGTTKAVTRVQESVGASVRLQALLDEPRDLVERPDARLAHGLGSGVRLEQVSFAYPEGDGNAIDALDLELRPGETLALVGPSGAGKTTLIDLVARFIDPSRGRVTVDGEDLRELTLDSWIAQYALVGQEPFLFHTTIEENIRYGKPGATRAEVEAAARAAGIHEFIAALPQGYATDVADSGSRLSGGQRQRITIARAFLKDAPLLLLDEATSSLDVESEAIVQSALERLMAHKTVLVIAHRLSTIRHADRIAVLDRGRLVELGTHEALLARRGTYARLFAAQFAQQRELEAPVERARS